VSNTVGIRENPKLGARQLRASEPSRYRGDDTVSRSVWDESGGATGVTPSAYFAKPPQLRNCGHAKAQAAEEDLTRQVGDDVLVVTAYSPCASAIAPSTPERGPSAGGTT
jgi:hypothetical protein